MIIISINYMYYYHY